MVIFHAGMATKQNLTSHKTLQSINHVTSQALFIQ